MLQRRLYNGELNQRHLMPTPLVLASCFLALMSTSHSTRGEDAETIADLVAEHSPGEVQTTELPMSKAKPAITTDPSMQSVDVLPVPMIHSEISTASETETLVPIAPRIPTSWLDIRPRSIGPERELVEVAEIPGDTSELPAVDPIATWTHCYRADYALSDFICGASFLHRPLHFEDPYLERYGRTIDCTKRWPAAHSSFHMIWKTSTLPISLAIDPPWQRHRSGFREPYWARFLRR